MDGIICCGGALALPFLFNISLNLGVGFRYVKAALGIEVFMNAGMFRNSADADLQSNQESSAGSIVQMKVCVHEPEIQELTNEVVNRLLIVACGFSESFHRDTFGSRSCDKLQRGVGHRSKLRRLYEVKAQSEISR